MRASIPTSMNRLNISHQHHPPECIAINHCPFECASSPASADAAAAASQSKRGFHCLAVGCSHICPRQQPKLWYVYEAVADKKHSSVSAVDEKVCEESASCAVAGEWRGALVFVLGSETAFCGSQQRLQCPCRV